MKRKYEVQVAVELTRWYDIEAESVDEADEIASRMMHEDIDIDKIADGRGGKWHTINMKVEQVLEKKKEGLQWAKRQRTL